MIRTVSVRRGSALLIVLGMVAFMVISAVAFSAYMRFSRLPSSYLRRTVASRMLAKAALASAIDEIDAAIGNNPHPGLDWMKDPKSNLKCCFPRNTTNLVGNVWMGRVYIGTNASARANHLLAAQQETVSPLSLEALAYLPPALVNEVRYFSRHAGSARWKWLPYDVGRYAFCAVDVSDYFDVNAVGVGARTSDPQSAVSMAYLFEDTGHTSASGDWNAANWESGLQSLYDGNGKVPLISMADWNLAVHANNIGGLTSPFCDYVSQNKTTFNSSDPAKIGNMVFVTDSYFPTNETSGSTGSSVKTEPYYLDDPNNQPFKATSQGIVQGKSAFEILTGGTGSTLDGTWRKYLGLTGLCTLYDYLDLDSVPCSLALPTCERVPMVCGLNLALPTLSLTVNQTLSAITHGESVSEQNGDVEKRTVEFTVTYNLDGTPFLTLAATQFQTLLVYPFRHDDGLPVQNFQVDGWMSLFLSSAQMKLRTDSLNDVLHFSDNLANQNDYQVAPNKNAVVSIPFTPQTVSFDLAALEDQARKNDSGDADAQLARVKTLDLLAQASTSIAGNIAKCKICEITFKGTQKRTRTQTPGGGSVWGDWEPKDNDLTENPMKKDYKSDPCNADVKATTDFIPLKADGTADTENFGKEGADMAAIFNLTSPLKVYLNVAAWVRVRDQNNKIVDLVPACLTDDCKLGIAAGAPMMYQQLDDQFYGKVFPLLRFDTGLSLDYGSKIAATAGATWQQPEPIFVGDPRYNHAPESWFVPPASVVSALQTGWANNAPKKWLDECNAQEIERDGDIFMSVSDQGYLQSIYELANLPRLTQFYASGANYGLGSTGGELYEKPDSAWTGVNFPRNFTDMANNQIMWRTYDPFPRTGAQLGSFGQSNGRNCTWNPDGDCFDPTMLATPIYDCILPAPPKFAMNPYSDGRNLLVAALANTPHEWRLAGKNEQASVIQEGGLPEDAASFNAKYAWNQYSTGACIKWDDLNEFITRFTNEIRQTVWNTDPRSENAVGVDKIVEWTWKDVWDNLPWNDENVSTSERASKKLCGFDLSNATEQYRLYATDRKFLYGYWRNCFAVKQQLFLIFVRAEPAMMGGEAPGATPPQLGVRAVALVWRDPTWSPDEGSNGDSYGNIPHKTRILFYRQFE